MPENTIADEAADRPVRRGNLGRLGDALASLDWMRLFAEFLIVLLGVFLGMQVSNWNEVRRERANTLRLLDQLRPELEATMESGEDTREYYAITSAEARTAMAGWAGDPQVSDREFVIGAYQASQIVGSGTNSEVWSSIFGADQVRQIEDIELRRALVRVLSVDISQLDWRGMLTDYRTEVRTVIPLDVQEAIRARCGDRINPETQQFSLPRRCDAQMPQDRWNAAAEALRAHPELVGELAVHQSTVATMLANMANFDNGQRKLLQAIDNELRGETTEKEVAAR